MAEAGQYRCHVRVFVAGQYRRHVRFRVSAATCAFSCASGDAMRVQHTPCIRRAERGPRMPRICEHS